MIWLFRKVSPAMRRATLTGATANLTANHRSRDHGDVHEHTWQITVWFETYNQTNALHLRSDLLNWIKRYEGKCLPDEIAWAEDMAKRIERDLTPDCDGYSGWMGRIHSVLIERHKEGLLACVKDTSA